MRRLVLRGAGAAIVLCACSGARVGAVADAPPRWTPGAASAGLAAPSTLVLAASADATVSSVDGHQAARLGTEPWLRVGSDGLNRWFTYVAFDLSYIPDDLVLGGAVLELPITGDRRPQVTVTARTTVTAWDEHRVSWRRQPRVSWAPVAQVVVESEQTAIVLDVGSAVARARARGEMAIGLLLSHEHGAEAGALAGPSRESEDALVALETHAATLRLTAGDGVTPPTQADLYQLLPEQP